MLELAFQTFVFDLNGHMLDVELSERRPQRDKHAIAVYVLRHLHVTTERHKAARHGPHVQVVNRLPPSILSMTCCTSGMAM